MIRPFFLIVLLTCLKQTKCQSRYPASKPFAYPGMPSTPYGPDWQAYFKVEDKSFATADQVQLYAGSVSVDRPGQPNNTLFFMGYEHEPGSLTAKDGERSNQPWLIFLAGGPGGASSSLPAVQTGPVLIRDGIYLQEGSPGTVTNPYAWNKLVDTIYVDQPVGVGFSTVGPTGWILDEDEMGHDFSRFLKNLVSVFPSLKRRPLYLMGESYGGVFVPYIAKTVFAQTDPPVNIAKLVIGEGAVGNLVAYREYPLLSLLQTYPQLIDGDPGTYEYFVEQYNLCGFNLTLQYPSPAPYPTLRYPSRKSERFSKHEMMMTRSVGPRSLIARMLSINEQAKTRSKSKRADASDPPRPHLTPIGKVDPEWGCSVMGSLFNHVATTQDPWKNYGIHYGSALYGILDVIIDHQRGNASAVYNNETIKTALHAPKKYWYDFIPYPFRGAGPEAIGAPGFGDPSIEPQVFLSDLATKVPLVFFSGNGDAVVGHRSTELAIQNFTFGGIRGFTARPSTPFTDEDGKFAGIIHQERNVTYALFEGAGHGVEFWNPKAMSTFLREFVFGNNQTGYHEAGSASVVGGIHTEFLPGIITESKVYTGNHSTQGTYTWAQSFWDKWGSFIATRTEADVPVASATGDGVLPPGWTPTATATSSGLREAIPWGLFAGPLLSIVPVLF